MYYVPDKDKRKDEYHEDWRLHLNTCNTKAVSILLQKSSNLRFHLYSRNIVEFFIWIVKGLEMPPEVIYLAIDIFDRQVGR